MQSITLFALVVMCISSSVLCRELAKRYGRDEIFYAVSGLVIGPLCLMVVLTPLPAERESPAATRVRRKPHFIEGPVCPECHRRLSARMTVCGCGCDVEIPWWERQSL